MINKKKILVIGSSNTDITVRPYRIPKPGETVLCDGFVMGPGGKGANQAVAAKRLGGDVSFYCKIGRDIFGRNALEHYRSCDLDTSGIMYSGKSSGVALITVDSKAENSIIVASGANGDITAEDISGLEESIARAGILLMQLEIPLDAVVKAAEIAWKAGTMVILNPAPAADLPAELFRFVSLLIPNETEASSLSGIDITDEVSAMEAVNVLKNKGVGNVIITMGSKGAMLCDGEVRLVPAKKVKAVDTTAAGDTFCGAVCVALSEGRSLEEAVRFATIASSLSVQKLGAQDSIPTRTEVDKLMYNI